MLKFTSKKEEFIYYVERAKFFQEKNEEEFVKCIEKAEKLLKVIEAENKKEGPKK